VQDVHATPAPVDADHDARRAYLTGAKSLEMQIATRQELLQLALKNAKRSVPLLVLACGGP